MYVCMYVCIHAHIFLCDFFGLSLLFARRRRENESRQMSFSVRRGTQLRVRSCALGFRGLGFQTRSLDPKPVNPKPLNPQPP